MKRCYLSRLKDKYLIIFDREFYVRRGVKELLDLVCERQQFTDLFFSQKVIFTFVIIDIISAVTVVGSRVGPSRYDAFTEASSDRDNALVQYALRITREYDPREIRIDHILDQDIHLYTFSGDTVIFCVRDNAVVVSRCYCFPDLAGNIRSFDI